MICAVKHDSGYHYLDATVKYNTPWEIPLWIQGSAVMIEDGDDFVIHRIPELEYSTNVYYKKSNLYLKDDTIVASEVRWLTGAQRYQMQQFLNDIPSGDLDKVTDFLIKLDNNNTEVVSKELTPIDRITDTFSISATTKTWNSAFESSGLVFLPLEYLQYMPYESIDTTRKINL